QQRSGYARGKRLNVDLLACQAWKCEEVLVARGTYLTQNISGHEDVLGDLVVGFDIIDVSTPCGGASLGRLKLGDRDLCFMKSEPAWQTNCSAVTRAAPAGSQVSSRHRAGISSPKGY